MIAIELAHALEWDIEQYHSLDELLGPRWRTMTVTDFADELGKRAVELLDEAWGLEKLHRLLGEA